MAAWERGGGQVSAVKPQCVSWRSLEPRRYARAPGAEPSLSDPPNDSVLFETKDIGGTMTVRHSAKRGRLGRRFVTRTGLDAPSDVAGRGRAPTRGIDERSHPRHLKLLVRSPDAPSRSRADELLTIVVAAVLRPRRAAHRPPLSDRLLPYVSHTEDVPREQSRRGPPGSE